MLSHDLRNAANAARLSADAPAADLRRVLGCYADAFDRAADRATELEAIVRRQQKIIAIKARLRRWWNVVTTTVVEAAR